jgi:hypothetical protein
VLDATKILRSVIWGDSDAEGDTEKSPYVLSSLSCNDNARRQISAVRWVPGALYVMWTVSPQGPI